MLTSRTLEPLQALRLTAMAQAWTAQQQDADLTALSFDERFALLVDAEWRARANKRLTRALQEAKHKLPQASIEAIDYPARRELDTALVRQLASCRWVAEHQQVLISGAPGTGKTFIACALANQACRKGYRARYWRASRLYHACPWPRPTAPTSGSSASWPGSTSASSTTGGSPPWGRPSAAMSSRSWRTAPAPARPSSPARSRRASGMTMWATRPGPTPSAIGCFTTPTDSC